MNWDNAGQLKSRTWNGETQVYGYDPAGQLLSVTAITPQSQPSSNSNPYRQVGNIQLRPETLLESYQYDGAGNMLTKYEEGSHTVMTYDSGNQLKTADTSGHVTQFQYDVGRLISQTGPEAKSMLYGFMDKVLVLTKGRGQRIGYDYYPDGQLAAKGPLRFTTKDQSAASANGASLFRQLSALESGDSGLEQSETQKQFEITEEYLWDGLGLLYRDGETYAIEPHPSGGVPIAATRDPQSQTSSYYINDILGTTLAAVHPDGVEIVSLTAFGKPGGLKTNSAPETAASKLSTDSVTP